VDNPHATRFAGCQSARSFDLDEMVPISLLLPRAFPVNHSVNSRFLAQKWRVTRPERWGGALMGMADYTNRV
jgi:hypothetical protein